MHTCKARSFGLDWIGYGIGKSEKLVHLYCLERARTFFNDFTNGGDESRFLHFIYDCSDFCDNSPMDGTAGFFLFSLVFSDTLFFS